jgi:hypothetical protein
MFIPTTYIVLIRSVITSPLSFRLLSVTHVKIWIHYWIMHVKNEFGPGPVFFSSYPSWGSVQSFVWMHVLWSLINLDTSVIVIINDAPG